MRKLILTLSALSALSACSEYQGRQTNCWGSAPSETSTVTKNCHFVDLTTVTGSAE